jgi:hypothetical protein
MKTCWRKLEGLFHTVNLEQLGRVIVNFFLILEPHFRRLVNAFVVSNVS